MSKAKKDEQLGMPVGTASNRLRKMIMFRYVVAAGDNFCYQCGCEIEDIEDLSIEHKVPWLDNSTDLFWDLNNIAFSHISCNTAAARKPTKRDEAEACPNGHVGECYRRSRGFGVVCRACRRETWRKDHKKWSRHRSKVC